MNPWSSNYIELNVPYFLKISTISIYSTFLNLCFQLNAYFLLPLSLATSITHPTPLATTEFHKRTIYYSFHKTLSSSNDSSLELSFTIYVVPIA